MYPEEAFQSTWAELGLRMLMLVMPSKVLLEVPLKIPGATPRSVWQPDKSRSAKLHANAA